MDTTASAGRPPPPAATTTTTSRGVAITLGAQAARVVIQVLSLMVLARLLDPADFGVVAMVTAVIVLAEILRDFGLYSAAIQAPTLTAAQRTNLFWGNTAAGLLCGIALCAGAGAIAGLYDAPELPPVIYALSAVFLLNGMATQYRAHVTRDMRFGVLAASDIASQALGTAAAIVGAAAGMGYWALVVQQLTVSLVVLLITAVASGWLPGLPRRHASMAPLLRFGRDLVGTRVAAYLPVNVDNIAIGALWGAGPLGIYSRAFQLVSMPINYISSPLMRVALPVLSRVSGDPAAYQRQTLGFQALVCYLSGTIFGLFAGLAEPLAWTLFGPGWLATAPIIAILAIGTVFRALAVVCDWVLLSAGMTGRQLRFTALTSPVWAAVIAVSALRGPVAVAAASAACSLVNWAAFLHQVSRWTGLPARALLTGAVVRLAAVPLPVGLLGLLASRTSLHPLLQILLGLCLAGAYVLLAQAVVPTVRGDLRPLLALIRRHRTAAEPTAACAAAAPTAARPAAGSAAGPGRGAPDAS